MHTHLLPPAHGSLLLYGVDQLLTYHYLVAELFMVLPLESEADSVSATGSSPPSPDVFFSWPKSRQAELVFEELFVKRTPLSEARIESVSADGAVRPLFGECARRCRAHDAMRRRRCASSGTARYRKINAAAAAHAVWCQSIAQTVLAS